VVQQTNSQTSDQRASGRRDDGPQTTARAVAEHEVTTLIRVQRPPTALVVGNNLMALGAMRAIRDAGLRIPDDAPPKRVVLPLDLRIRSSCGMRRTPPTKG
jgi:hypothetical protein